jgi:hypothetical protein
MAKNFTRRISSARIRSGLPFAVLPAITNASVAVVDVNDVPVAPVGAKLLDATLSRAECDAFVAGASSSPLANRTRFLCGRLVARGDEEADEDIVGDLVIVATVVVVVVVVVNCK